MQNPDQHHEQLVRYLLNELDVQEEISVTAWIEQSEENRRYFANLRDVVKLVAAKQMLDGVDVDKEWQRAAINIGLEYMPIPGDVPEETGGYAEMEEDEAATGKGKLRRILISVSVAACLVLLAGIGWRLFTADEKNTPALVKTGAVAAEPGRVALVREETNNTNKPKLLKLEDGSVIILSPNSTVSFSEPFTGNKRDIVLSGRAEFKVAKDRTKPFTVFSSEISTTALGTRFTVTAYHAANNITVRLYEGKVVVKSVAGARKKMDKDVYLLPGEELVYDTKSGAGSVGSFKMFAENIQTEKSGNNENIPAGEDPSVSSDNKAPWYMFNNQALPVVFEQLKEMYQVDIVYTKADVRKIYFIGRFLKSDSVETILRQIGALNRLKVTKTDHKFFIEKIK